MTLNTIVQTIGMLIIFAVSYILIINFQKWLAEVDNKKPKERYFRIGIVILVIIFDMFLALIVCVA